VASNNSPVFQRVVKRISRLSDIDLEELEAFLTEQMDVTGLGRDTAKQRGLHDTIWIFDHMKKHNAKCIVAIDFDGVLHQIPKADTAVFEPIALRGKPVKGAIKWLESILKDRDILVVLHSARLCDRANDNGAVQKAIDSWLQKYGLSEELLSFMVYSGDKPPAHLFIDDNSYRFTGENFPTSEQIKSFKSWIYDK